MYSTLRYKERFNFENTLYKYYLPYFYCFFKGDRTKFLTRSCAKHFFGAFRNCLTWPDLAEREKRFETRVRRIFLLKLDKYFGTERVDTILNINRPLTTTRPFGPIPVILQMTIRQ
jgi:hypothetical protein